MKVGGKTVFTIPLVTAFNPKINPQPSFRSSAKYPNLAPLRCDTVSFTGGKKDISFDEDDEVHGITKADAMWIYRDAKPAQNYLDMTLQDVLGDLVRPETGKGSLSKPIKSITSRIKQPDSLVEKALTRKLDSIAEVKENLTDIIGARIVMADSSKPAVDKVINRFTKAVIDNKIKILEIENYRPDPELGENDDIIKSYDYSSVRALKELKLACDDSLGRSIRKSDEDVESGYMAIHMLVQLPSGFVGEIQIIGSEVEKLKDIEDICYKYKSGKNIKNLPAKLKKNLLPLRNKKDEILRKEYNIYTRNAYIYQRDKELAQNPKMNDKEFLHIPEILPQALDFNNIYKELNK